MGATFLLLLAAAAPGAGARVVIENPHGFELALLRVQDDGASLERRLGTAAAPELALGEGCYVLEAACGTRRLRLPLPLPRRAEIPEVLRLRIDEPPPPREGWCWIPPGPALRGDVLGVGQEDERPARVIEVAGFWIGRHEVTAEEYARFLDAQPAVDPRWINLPSAKAGIRRDPASGRFAAIDPRMPVVTVSWWGAVAYCEWMTAATGERHRLPTESEWEKAARGPESFVYAYGNVYRTKAANQESGRLRPVGSFAPNGFGVYDLTGNAFEWVQDAYETPFPDGGRRPREEVADAPRHRVLRGGSFVLDGMYLRNSFRMHQGPSVLADDFGFRVVREGRPPRSLEEETR